MPSNYTVPCTNSADAADNLTISRDARDPQRVALATIGARVSLTADDAWGAIQGLLRALVDVDPVGRWESRVPALRKAIESGLTQDDGSIPTCVDDDDLDNAARTALAYLSGVTL